MKFDLVGYIKRHRDWSRRTFGNVASPESVTKHIAKELAEIMAQPDDLEEWVDVMILAIDGAWRFTGASPREIAAKLAEKQAKNFAREWPDPVPGEPTEHVK